MAEILSKKDIKFVKKVIETGEQTLAAKEAYEITSDNYAKVKGHRQMKKPKIQKAIADALPDDLLNERHLELLNKREVYKIGYGEGTEYEMSDQPDTQAVSKALDMAYKLKGSYAPEKSINMNIDYNEEVRSKSKDLIDKYLDARNTN